MRAWLLFVIGCSSSASQDVTGPYTGEVRRYVVDAITVPRDTTESDRFAADLDGDGVPENQLGLVTAVLSSTGDLSIHAADMIAAGALASVVELQADDLTSDPTVSVRYIGADGDEALAAGGAIVDGEFRSNRTATTRAPGRATVRLPIYTNADPMALALEGMELDLAPDGRGGFDAIVRGGIGETHARERALAGLVQMFETEPERHIVFARGLDRDRDGVFSQAELDDSVVSVLVDADVQLFRGARFEAVPASAMPESLSLAFAVHLAPCALGSCSSAVPAVRCRDRIRDGDETDVDCGGSCQPCGGMLACRAPDDCQTGACDGGRCRAPSCIDGVRSGYESDADCGGVCGACASGRACAVDGDCASGDCVASGSALGVCR